MKKAVLMICVCIMCCSRIWASGTSDKKVEYTPENPLVLRMSWAGTMEDFRGQSYQLFAKNVEERSGGAIRCEFFPSNQLGASKDVIEMISQGSPIVETCSADFYCDYGCQDLMLCNIFFTFSSIEKTFEFSDSEIFKEMTAKVEPNGLKILNIAFCEAPRQLMTTRPVKTLEDFKGLKVRIPSFVYGDFWNSIGAVATSVPLGDAYSALQTGILDATETTLNSLYNYSIHEVCKYGTLTGHTTAPGCFVMSTTIWNRLTEEQQRIIEEEAFAAGKWYSEQDLANSAKYQKLMEDAGVTFYTLSDEDMAIMKEKAIEQANSYVKTRGITAGLYDEIVEYLAD